MTISESGNSTIIKRIQVIIITGIIFFSSTVLADPGADIVYYESDLGIGLWRYDYTFFNISTNDESLYSVWFDFARESTITGMPLPEGWSGTLWEGTNYSAYINTFSISPVNDIAAGHAMTGFSFIIDYRTGVVPYTAYFSTSEGGAAVITGTSTVADELTGKWLFLSGVMMLLFKRRLSHVKS